MPIDESNEHEPHESSSPSEKSDRKAPELNEQGGGPTDAQDSESSAKQPEPTQPAATTTEGTTPETPDGTDQPEPEASGNQERPAASERAGVQGDQGITGREAPPLEQPADSAGSADDKPEPPGDSEAETAENDTAPATRQAPSLGAAEVDEEPVEAASEPGAASAEGGADQRSGEGQPRPDREPAPGDAPPSEDGAKPGEVLPASEAPDPAEGPEPGEAPYPSGGGAPKPEQLRSGDEPTPGADRVSPPDLVSEPGDEPGNEPDDEAPEVSPQSIEQVRDWLPEINHGESVDPFDPERAMNCGNCALAVNQRLEGNSDAVAGLGTLSSPEMEKATGTPQVPMTPESIEATLRELGPGSHAVIGIDRDGAAGHWFNAYFDGDKVYAIDGQVDKILGWPPDMSFEDAPVSYWDMGVRR